MLRRYAPIVGLCALVAYASVAAAQDRTEALEQRKTPQEFAKYREAAWAHFRKRCAENAGEKIYRTVENVEGIFLERPRTKPTEFELRDQYWMGDPYGLELYPPAEISGYLRDLDNNDIPSTKSTDHRGFRFVEISGSAGSGFVRHYIDNASDRVTSVQSDVRRSRYAVAWKDISTMEDRTYWVAGGRLWVVDLSTGEVLGERIGYVFETGFGSTAGGRRPWLIAQRNACPPIRRNTAMDRLFVERVLKPLAEERYAK